MFHLLCSCHSDFDTKRMTVFYCFAISTLVKLLLRNSMKHSTKPWVDTMKGEKGEINFSNTKADNL